MSYQHKAYKRVADGQQITAELLGATRPAMVRVGPSKQPPLTAEQRQTIIDGLRSGQSLASILRDNPDMPGAGRVYYEKRKDEAFGKEYDEARADGVATNIDEALDYSFAVRGNKELSIAASKYADAIFKSAPLQSPREYGQLLKVADANGNKLSIALVSFASPQSVPIEAHAETLALPATDKPENSGAD